MGVPPTVSLSDSICVLKIYHEKMPSVEWNSFQHFGHIGWPSWPVEHSLSTRCWVGTQGKKLWSSHSCLLFIKLAWTIVHKRVVCGRWSGVMWRDRISVQQRVRSTLFQSCAGWQRILTDKALYFSSHSNLLCCLDSVFFLSDSLIPWASLRYVLERNGTLKESEI